MARSRLKVKGRRENGFFVAVPKIILESEEYAGLTAFEVKLLMDLFAQFNGSNNGDLHCAWRLMRNRGWHSQDTMNRALRGLLEAGFLQRTRQGGKHKCSLYAVTWLPINECAGKLDGKATKVAPATWKNKSVLRETEQSAPGGVVINAP